MSATVHVEVAHGGQIGDCLSHIPYIDFLCRKHSARAFVTGGFNRLVRRLLGPSYKLEFEYPPPSFEAEYRMDVGQMMGLYGMADLHMCQTYFRNAGEPTPALPIALDLMAEPCGLEPGIVVSPYSHSDSGGNKLWPHDRWLEVSRLLPPDIPRYVVGTRSQNDPAPYLAEGFEPVFDQPLGQVLDLLRQARVALTIDNGVSHLAHYGAVDRHVLLYPVCFSESWVTNPRAMIVRGAPSSVQPAQMAQAAMSVLGAQ